MHTSIENKEDLAAPSSFERLKLAPVGALQTTADVANERAARDQPERIHDASIQLSSPQD